MEDIHNEPGRTKLPRRIEKPWGYELLWALTPKYAGKVLFVKKGHRLSLQYHRKKQESIYIYSGKVHLEIESPDGQMTLLLLEPGRCFDISAMTKHRIEGLEDTTLFEVSTAELDDVVRVADDYGR